MRLSVVTIAAMKSHNIDASNSIPPSSAQLEQITQILRADPEFPGYDWQPTVVELYWIRRGLPLDPFAVIQFDEPPGISRF